MIHDEKLYENCANCGATYHCHKDVKNECPACVFV